MINLEILQRFEIGYDPEQQLARKVLDGDFPNLASLQRELNHRIVAVNNDVEIDVVSPLEPGDVDAAKYAEWINNR